MLPRQPRMPPVQRGDDASLGEQGQIARGLHRRRQAVKVAPDDSHHLPLPEQAQAAIQVVLFHATMQRGGKARRYLVVLETTLQFAALQQGGKNLRLPPPLRSKILARGDDTLHLRRQSRLCGGGWGWHGKRMSCLASLVQHERRAGSGRKSLRDAINAPRDREQRESRESRRPSASARAMKSPSPRRREGTPHRRHRRRTCGRRRCRRKRG